jgi:hypothetical protein
MSMMGRVNETLIAEMGKFRKNKMYHSKFGIFQENQVYQGITKLLSEIIFLPPLTNEFLLAKEKRRIL